MVRYDMSHNEQNDPITPNEMFVGVLLPKVIIMCQKLESLGDTIRGHPLHFC